MLLVIGLGIGILLGLTGAGGSVFAVPLLVMFASFPMNEAVGISLGAVAASTLYGSLSSGKKGALLWMPGIVLALSGAVTAPLGKMIGNQIPEHILIMGFALLATVIAMRMLWTAKKKPELAQVVRGSNFSTTQSPSLICTRSMSGRFEFKPRCLAGLILGGSLVGLLSGLFGVGGGFLIVPLLMALSAVSIKQAVNTSLLIITLISSSGFISHLMLNESPQWQQLAWVAAGGILGMLVGQALSAKIAGPRLQQLFAFGLVLISIGFVFGRAL